MREATADRFTNTASTLHVEQNAPAGRGSMISYSARLEIPSRFAISLTEATSSQ